METKNTLPEIGNNSHTVLASKIEQKEVELMDFTSFDEQILEILQSICSGILEKTV
jgi:hypothetical protein